MALLSKVKKPETKVIPTKTSNAGPVTSAVAPVVSAAPTKATRELVAIFPSELKAFVSVNGKRHKVIYHTKGGEALIGLAGRGSVKLSEWLKGTVELTGLG
jgi:hypothetical protein